MSYGPYPSPKLKDMFRHKPYQGQDPARARVLVIGNDANYSADLSDNLFFDRIIEYHDDGVRFWTKYGAHHPFLLPEYPLDRRSGGVPYHAKFAKMGFLPSDAPLFSFVELLNVPTTGNTGENPDLFFSMLDRAHLRWLESLVFSGLPKFVLVNQTLVRTIDRISRKHDVLVELAARLSRARTGQLRPLAGGTVIHNGRSFSSACSDAYLKALGQEIRSFIATGGARAQQSSAG